MLNPSFRTSLLKFYWLPNPVIAEVVKEAPSKPYVRFHWSKCDTVVVELGDVEFLSPYSLFQINDKCHHVNQITIFVKCEDSVAHERNV